MLIVDAQVHIWGNGKPTNAAHRQVSAFSKDELLKEMDEDHGTRSLRVARLEAAAMTALTFAEAIWETDR